MRYKARAAVLYQAMKARGESTRTLARRVGCSHVMIWKLVNERKACTEALATKIATALDVQRDDLFFTHPVR